MSRPDLFLRERQATIQNRLQSEGRVVAVSLANEFGVSEDTIRRDLRDMAALGLCRRVYGGALPLPPSGGDLKDRQHQNREEKRKLAAIAVRFIKPGMTVFFDAGSANLAIAEMLPDDLHITAATNAPLIAATLSQKSGVDLITIGGQIDHHVGGAVDQMAQQALLTLRPDLCILGACGLDAEAGVTAFVLNDALFKKAAARQSRSVLISITADKYQTEAPFPVIEISNKVHCITLAMPDDLQKTFEQKGAIVYSA